MVAGEASGDLLAAQLIAALKARGRPMLFAGIGGPKMTAQGLDSEVPMDKLSVRGYAEALRHYREIMSIRRRLGSALIAERPDLFIGVDSSDFNLGLERRLKDAGIPVTYVGHPLADLIPLKPNRQEARAQLRLPQGKLIVALLPGSRRSELQYMGTAFLLAAHRFRQEVHDVHFVCPTVTRETRDMFERAVHENQRTDLPLTLLFGHSHEALAAADLALVASGTATLEAALFKTPMVIAYRQSPLTWALMRSMLYLPYVGMPNVLAGEKLVPELLQGDATPAALSAALLALLRDGAAQRRQVERFHEFHHLLRQNTAEKAADAVLAVLERKNS